MNPVHSDSPCKNTEVCCHTLLQGIVPIQGSNLGHLHYRWILYCLSHQGSPIIGKRWKQWQSFLFFFVGRVAGDFKITSNGDCSHEIKICLFFGRKTMVNLNRSRDYHFANKGPYSQSYGFTNSHVWMWNWKIWKKKKRLSDEELMLLIELWCWRNLLRVSWTARR